MTTLPLPDIFKAYDIRGIYGEQIDGELAERIGRAFAEVLAGLAGKPAAELRVGLGRDMRLSAPELAARYREGLLAAGAHVLDAGPGRQRDALLPRRLARARRRPDVHRLAQPEGVHGCEARARGRDRPVGRGRHPGHPPGAGRRSAARREPSPARSRGSTSTRSSKPRRCGSSTATRSVRRRRRLRVVVDGGNGMAGPMVGPLLESLGPRARRDLLDPRRQLPRPRAQPAAAREQALHHRAGARRARRPRDRLGRRRRPLLLHRRRRASSWPATSSRRCSPSRCCAGTPARRSSTTSAPRAPSPTR